MPQHVTSGRFVGRAEELALLGELLGRAGGGEPLVALVGGEAASTAAEPAGRAALRAGVRGTAGFGASPLRAGMA